MAERRERRDGGTIPVIRRAGESLAALWNQVTGWVRETFGAGKALAAPERAGHAIQSPPAGQVWKNYVFIGTRRAAVRVYGMGA